MVTEDLLKEVLEVLLKNGLVMVGVYWLMERPFMQRLFDKVKPFLERELDIPVSVFKRYVSMFVSVGLSVSIFTVYAAFGYDQIPVNLSEWLNLALTLGSINWAGSQIIHAKDLKFKRD